MSSQASTAASASAPNSEALALSASLFTSSIASWLPANFGVVRSEQEKAREFDLALSERSGDRLGLGHPTLLQNEKRGQSSKSAAGLGLASLSKRLNRVRRDDVSGQADLKVHNGKDRDEDEDEDAESRARSVGKGKGKMSARTVLDPFASKKQKKQQHRKPIVQKDPSELEPTSNGSDQTPISSRADTPVLIGDDSSDKDRPSTPPRTSISSPGGSGDFPFDGPRALDSPAAKTVIGRTGVKRRLSGVSDGAGTGDNSPNDSPGEAGVGDAELEERKDPITSESLPASQGSNKTQQRREKRKRAKQAKVAH